MVTASKTELATVTERMQELYDRIARRAHAWVFHSRQRRLSKTSGGFPGRTGYLAANSQDRARSFRHNLIRGGVGEMRGCGETPFRPADAENDQIGAVSFRDF